MKKLFIFLFLLFVSVSVYAAPPSRINTYTPGEIISSSEVTENEDAIFNYLQGGIDAFADGSIVNADVNSTANIQSDKLNLTAIGQNVAITSGYSFTNAGSFTQTGTSATFSGVTIANLGTVTTADINGGTLDGAVVGGSSAANGTFTNLTANTTLKLGTTNQGDVLYDNGTSIVRLTPGTSGYFLKTQGAAANPTWAVAGNYIWQSTTTMTAVTVSTNATISPNKRYKVVIDGVKETTTDPIRLRFEDNAGSDYDYKSNAFYMDATADATSESEAGSAIIMTADDVDVNAAFKIEFILDTTKRNSDSAFVVGSAVFGAPTAGYAMGHFAGVYDVDTTISSFEIGVSDGTMSGSIYLYELTVP